MIINDVILMNNLSNFPSGNFILGKHSFRKTFNVLLKGLIDRNNIHILGKCISGVQ